MKTPIGKRSFSGAMVAAVGMAALGGSLISAQASFANVPAAGLSCVGSDGKINGRGSTYQENAQAAFFAGFRDDFCGAASGSDVAGNMMGIYNYPNAASSSNTGSGNGIAAANCRTDAFAGSDTPYSEGQLAILDGTPVGGGTQTLITPACSAFPGTGTAALGQPFAPNSTTAGAYPAANDAAGNIMAFPIAGSSVAIAVNLTAADCGGTKPGPLNFTGAQLSAIMGGGVAAWNDPILTAGNPTLATCVSGSPAVGVPITRVVRQDKSGTTGILKNFLIRADDSRAQAGTCSAGATWSQQGGSQPTWPNSGTCSALTHNALSGGPSLIQTLGATDGGVGYADLSDEVAGVTSFGFITPSMQNGAGTAFTAPGGGKQANCDFSVLGLPGSSFGDAVGLNANDNWGSDNATVNGKPNHVNATDVGVKYPICGITFDMVYSGLADGSVANPIAALSSDQRRTMYSYFTYVLSGTAQALLAKNYYSSVPVAWLPKLQGGFQQNY